MVGTIARIKFDGGFGFIRADELPEDLFFHRNDLRGLEFDEQLKYRRVSFEAFETPRGWAAKDVKPE